MLQVIEQQRDSSQISMIALLVFFVDADSFYTAELIRVNDVTSQSSNYTLINPIIAPVKT